MQRGASFLLIPGTLTSLTWAKIWSTFPGHCAVLLGPRSIRRTWSVGHLPLLMCIMVRDGIYLWPLGEVVSGNQDVSFSALTLQEGFCDECSDPLRQCLDVMLLHQAPAPSLGTSAHCTDVTLSKLLLECTTVCLFFKYLGDPKVSQMVIHGAVPAGPSPCSMEGLCGLSWFFCQPNPSGDAVCHLSFLGFPLGSLFSWSYWYRCSSVQDIVQFPFQ